MKTQEMLTNLARRAVAAPGWRWMPGMLTAQGRVTACGLLSPEGLPLVSLYTKGRLTLDYPDSLDLLLVDSETGRYDPATVGCLFALMNDAQGHGGWEPNVGAMVSALEQAERGEE